MTDTATPSLLQLGVPGFSYADLYAPERLRDLHDVFLREVGDTDPDLRRRWDAYRADPDAPRPAPEVSLLYVQLAPYLSRFVARMFGIEAEVRSLADATAEQDVLFRFKADFVRRRVLPLLKGGQPVAVTDDERALVEGLVRAQHPSDGEMALARAGCLLLDREIAAGKSGDEMEQAAVASAIEAMRRWCAAHMHDDGHRSWVVFKVAGNVDYFKLVEVEHPRADVPTAMTGPDRHLRRRDGFTLTDPRMTGREVLSEVNYCVLCHEREKDSCAKGLLTKGGKVQENPLGIPLEGCPLDERISEMHLIRKRGDAVGALALVTIDNPMCAGTGHRICNDCMKACIFQKQDPVNIPQIETGILTDVLRLPWGVEIYGLLTRWNPLNVRRPYALPYNGRKVLVVGMGPAGYTLAHYLVNEGFGVVGVDGLKIEPLPEAITGTDMAPPEPVRDWTAIYSPLDERPLEGFGGVSEYGITVRWDKNFLTLLHLTLARRSTLRMYGGIRFGGTLSLEDAWQYGFDHVAIAAGAGKPTIVDMKNNLLRGIRQASDFLMGLQLTGAFKRSAFANLQVRMPCLVIGGGLTAIDTATEVMAFYPLQVEKLLDRYEALCAQSGEDAIRAVFDDEERGLLDEFVAHGREVRAERARAAAAGGGPDFVPLMKKWGGVSLVYRKGMLDSPAYRLNHEEITKSLEEGITFVERMNPEEAIPDEFGHVSAVRFREQLNDNGKWREGDATVTLPARSVFVAAGTTPNVTYEREYPGTFQMDEKRRFFKPHAAERSSDGAVSLVAASEGFFTSYNRDGKYVTYYGDNHPKYAGNVVKAMASARDGYPHIVGLFPNAGRPVSKTEQAGREAGWSELTAILDHDFLSRVERVVRLTPTIVEVIVKAPAAARHFQPGQFYRLQNFETLAPRLGADGTGPRMLMEGLALTGAWVDKERGLLSMIALEMGVSSRQCAYLKPGEPVLVMGPTGAPTEIPHGENVLLAGGGLGNAVLFSIAKALRAKGNKVLYFAGYKNGADLFKREEVEAATDQVVWTTDTGVEIPPSRPQDAHFRGNIVQAMIAYAKGELGQALVPLNTVDRIIAIGSDRMMAAIKLARLTTLEPYLKEDHVAIASINSPMQCMMKEVCAQCLQRHVDPKTGKETIIFTCFNQDQHMDRVDFPNLSARLRQNTVKEKLAGLWFEKLMAERPLGHV
jgi:NADPH-dependent glutamate synthase beta subunit-like oxidoreductase/NAD(P)H-flavin reductase